MSFLEQKVVIVDYGMGNLRSVQKAFENCGVKALVSSKKVELKSADKIVLPGVGAFSHAMRELQKLRLRDILIKKIVDGTPYLGICLGLQILFDGSFEGGTHRGLGLIPGYVRRFRTRLKVPHMGWNKIKVKDKNNLLFKGVRAGSYFYFVHSYCAVPKDKKYIAATCDYDGDFCAAVRKDNIYATQFHPEKSQQNGLALISNFTRL